MDFLHKALALLQALPPETWVVLGLPLAGLQEAFHKWLNVQSPKIKLLLTSLFSFIVAAVPAILGVLQANPAIIGAHTATVFMGMTLAYRFYVKGASQRRDDVREFKQSQKTTTTEATTSQLPAESNLQQFEVK